MKHVTFFYLLGMGGYYLDPGGATQIHKEINALKGTFCPLPFQYTECDKVAYQIKHLASDETIVVSGDSCGANRLAWIAAAVYPRKIALLYVINASIYCNLNCPPIPDNVEEVYDIYGGMLTFGLSQFEPPLQVPPTKWDTNETDLRVGVGNNGKTKITYQFIEAAHPDDNDYQRVQLPLINKVKQLLV